MRWLFLLVAVVASASAAPVKEDPQALAQRLLQTEEECEHLRNLAGVQAEYADLADACEASLLLDSYAYIDQNNVDMDTAEERFPVTTSKGEGTVKKPPKLSTDELQAMLQKYQEKQPLDEKSASKRAQEIVDQQVLCELQESTGEDECTKKLNCLKDAFMADQNINLKDNPKTFLITFKGKEVKIASPPDADRTELCKSYSSATQQEEAAVETSGEKNDGENNDGDNEFTALDNLAEETPKYKQGSNKMVTKSLDNPLVDFAIKTLADSVTGGGSGGGGGKSGFVGDLTSKVMGMAAPQLGGMLTQNLMSKYAKGTPLAMMRPQDMNTLMKIASNGFKPKENRERISKADVKAAIEVVTKTAVHFAILSLQAHKTVNDEANQKKKKKGLAKFVETLEVAMLDALAATAVNYIVDMIIPDDEDLPPVPPTVKPAKGMFGALTRAASDFMTAPAAGPAVKAVAPAPVVPAASSPGAGLVKGVMMQLLKTALSGQ